MTDPQTAGALAVRSSQDLEQLSELEGILLGTQMPPDEVFDDPEAITREIVMQILGADSDEELQNFGEATGWGELLDIPMVLHGFKWRRSDMDPKEGGAPVYFIVNATNARTGEAIVLTTGSRNIMATLINLARRGTLEGSIWAAVKADKPTKSGYYPLWLVKVSGPPAADSPAEPAAAANA